MRIALFEDNDEHADKLIDLIDRWAMQNGKAAVVNRFSSPYEATELSRFGCLLLDVEMPGMNGIEFARHIRSSGSKLPIVFISSHTEYSIDGYEVNALRFIDKNSKEFESKLFECLDKTSYEVENSLNAYYNIGSSNRLLSIPMHEILYFEILDHELIIHTVAGTFSERKTLKELKRILPKQFVQIGRSHVVNILQVAQITPKQASFLDGTSLPVAPKYSCELYEAFLAMR